MKLPDFIDVVVALRQVDLDQRIRCAVTQDVGGSSNSGPKWCHIFTKFCGDNLPSHFSD